MSDDVFTTLFGVVVVAIVAFVIFGMVALGNKQESFKGVWECTEQSIDSSGKVICTAMRRKP